MEKQTHQERKSKLTTNRKKFGVEGSELVEKTVYV